MSINPAESEIWGSLYGTDEMRAIFSDRAQLQCMLDVEAALARAQAQLGLVPAHVAAAITAAAKAENMRLGHIAASTRTIGYPVVGMVRELGRVAGEEAARSIHLGATTQDILDTALVMQTRRACRVLRRDLLALARTLAEQAVRYRDTPMAGRTHLQQAVPITFGLKCAVWAAPFAAHIERLDAAMGRTLVVEFGGAAGTLAPLGADGIAVVEALAQELDLGIPDLPWHVVRDGVAEIVTLLGLICGSVAKFALDITLLTQTEVAEVCEPHETGRGGSSTMPQKRNPIASEYILAATRGVHALVPLMLGAMVQDHERGTGPWQTEPLVIPQCFVLTAGVLRQARTIAEGMIVDAERMRQNLEATGGLIMAEAVAAALTPTLGRAAAEEALKRACDRALAEGRTLSDTLRNDPVLRPYLSDVTLDRLMDPASYLGSAGAFVDRVAARIAALKEP
jgi:3-carboxy-cis,cis-muconate cycloisomerase